MSTVDKIYGEMIKETLEEGYHSKDRTGTGTTRESGFCVKYDLTGGKVPVLGSKKVNLEAVIKELVWFVKGSTNINSLGCKIWDEWADENGDLGPIYGKQWRNWVDTKIVPHGVYEGHREEFLERGYKIAMMDDKNVAITREIDQLQRAVELLISNPDSRRIIVSAWNVGDLEDMALEPCHSFFQFLSVEMSLAERAAIANRYIPETVRVSDITITDDPTSAHLMLTTLGVPSRKLTCLMYQRSGDMFLGVPFNISSYALLTHLVAHLTGHEAGALIHIIGDAHIYDNHRGQCEEQMKVIKDSCKFIPGTVTFEINKNLHTLDGVSVDSFIQKSIYIHHPAIKAPIAV